MKILFVSRRYAPSIGGVEKHVKEVAERLQEEGNEVTVITERYKKSLKKEQIINGVKVNRIDFPKIKYIGLIKIWTSLLKKITLFKQSDIVHIHDVMIWVFPLKILLVHKKFYLTMHGWEGKFPIPPKLLYLKRISNNLAAKSMAIGKFIEKHYGVKADIISYGAVDVPTKVYKKKNIVLYIGRFSEDTGLPILLDALKIMPGTKAIFIGKGPLKRNCKLVGKVLKEQDPRKYIKKAKILYVSGYLTLLEGVANKCIVYAGFDNKLRQDYLQKTPFSKWIFIYNDPVKLALSMKFHLEDEKSEYTIKAYQWAKKQTWGKLVEDYKNLWSN